MRHVMTKITRFVHHFDDLSTPPALLVLIHSDSQVTLHITKNQVFYERIKHMELDYHFVHQQYLFGLITLSFVPSKHHIADLFIKTLSGEPHHDIWGNLGSCPSLPT